MDAVYRAIADPHRRQILERLRRRNGQTLQEIAGPLPISRQAVSKHLDVLERASLIVPLWKGQKKLHYVNVFPLQEIAHGWLANFADSEGGTPDER